MVILTHKLRRSLSVAIPLFTVGMYWGVIKAFFDVDASTNIAHSGVTLGFIVGAFNLLLWWMVWKHKVP